MSNVTTGYLEAQRLAVYRQESLRRLLIAVFLLTFQLLVLSIPEPSRSQDASPENLNRVIAKVNDVPITARMLNQAMQERIPTTGHRMISEKRFSEIQQEELDKLIIKELLVQEARRSGIKADPGEIALELKKIEDRFPGKKQFEQALQLQGLTLSDVQMGLDRHIVIQKIVDQEVYSKMQMTDSELKEYYEGHQEQFRIPEQIRLRLLLVRVDPSGMRTDWKAGRKKAQELADKARGGEDFASLAVQFSDDEMSQPKGGDTGLLHQGRLPYKELEAVAFSHNVGEVSHPVETLYGYVVFKVEEKHPSKQLAYSEVNKEFFRREMMEAAAKRRLDEWIAGLKAGAEITTD
jgi:parvulin-like peptidyl-prolyl isomerase